MDKKKYVKPSFEVYELKNQPKLLAGSEGLGNPNPFAPGGDPFNPVP